MVDEFRLPAPHNENLDLPTLAVWSRGAPRALHRVILALSLLLMVDRSVMVNFASVTHAGGEGIGSGKDVDSSL